MKTAITESPFLIAIWSLEIFIACQFGGKSAKFARHNKRLTSKQIVLCFLSC